MTSDISITLAWIRLSQQPLRYAHVSWQPQLPIEIDTLSLDARRALERQMCRALNLVPLTQRDALQRGVGVGLISPAAHATLLNTLLRLSKPDATPAATSSAAGQLAKMLGRLPLPWRPLHAVAHSVAGTERLLSEQLAARLCAAAAPMGEAWSSRWRLRFDRDLPLTEVRTTATQTWWGHVEDCLYQLHGDSEKLPCL